MPLRDRDEVRRVILNGIMQTHIGSIQRKGRRYYLVVTIDGKQKWMALRTGRKPIARRRAAMLAPANSDDEESWLYQLVHIGETARDALYRKRLAGHLSWENLWRQFEATSQAQIPVASKPSYRRWIQLLSDTINELSLAIPDPLHMSHTAARQVSSFLAERYVSVNRMLVFYHRVWRTLSMDDGVWKDVRVSHGTPAERRREYYRRLSIGEVSKIVQFLEMAGRQDYADMVVIGFYTGLRLSDVAELELAEISPDRKFLHILPNKVRLRKNRILTIPLIKDARVRVMRRIDEMPSANRTECGKRIFLFPESTRKRPSRPLSAAFRACEILKVGNGRASFHSLRATFISLMDEAGIPPHITDAITGHADGGMHARYTQPTPTALLDATMRALPRLPETAAT